VTTFPAFRLPARRRTALLATAAILALQSAPAALAADDALGADPQVTTVPGVTVYGPLPAGYRADTTSTATRTNTALEDVPQSITVITSDLIEDQAMQGMADVVLYVPGVTMGQGEGHRDAPTIRGNASTADFFVDGVRDDVQYYRDLYNAERIEVLKGPNAMIFGRGGGGGVINRVTKAPFFDAERSLTLEGGSNDHWRFTTDLNQPLGETLAGRLNLMFEDSGSYRDHVELERWGVNPTVLIQPNERLSIQLGYEHFSDQRVVDRGVPSYQGRPLATDASTYFGNPDVSRADAAVDALNSTVQYIAGSGLVIRNRTAFADYDKFYQNVFPGAVSPDGSQVSIAAYNNHTRRENLFSQTDLIFNAYTGEVRHTLLAGLELGRQRTSNFRNTGYFNNVTTSVLTPVTSPTVAVPVTFRQSATDADNHVDATVAALYVQDQMQLTQSLQLVLGLRFDVFDLDFRNNRNGEYLGRRDELWSPRAGVIWSPIEPLSLYASYSISHLPSSGDQFASLTATSQTLEPEEFTSYEIGARYTLRPGLVLSGAVYRLDRENTSARDPLDPSLTVQTGATRSEGVEIGLAGQINRNWRVMGGYAYQEAEIVSDTTVAAAGQQVPLTPRHSFSLWNRYQFTPKWAAGLGVIHQDEVFTGIDNAVVLPEFTRVDAAVYYDVTDNVRAQLNVENLFDEGYYSTAHSNNNITPGAPRAFRVSLTTRF